jgi:hypothetical protein
MAFERGQLPNLGLAMAIAKITGSILPEIFRVHTRDHPTVHWKSPNEKIDVDFDIQFQESIVTITCTLNSFDLNQQMPALLQNAQKFAQASIDLICFRTGEALVVYLKKLEAPDGRTLDIVQTQRSFAALASSIHDDEGFREILKFILREPNLLLAVRDLADSIRFSDTAEINCTRAIEAVRNYFIPQNGERKDGWSAMRQCLNLTERYTRLITESSRAARHGARADPGIDDLQEVGRRAWTVVNRFFEYHKRGNQPLPVADFPLLD